MPRMHSVVLGTGTYVICDLQICCDFTTQNIETDLKTNDETITFLICLFVLFPQLDRSLTPSTAPIFEVRLNQKNLENLPRRNTRKGTGTKGRPVFRVWIFSLRKKVKKSFKVLSTGLQYLVCGCTMITFLFVPKVWKRALFILQKSSDFPGGRLGVLACQRWKIHGASSVFLRIYLKSWNSVRTERLDNFSNSVLITIKKHRNRTMTTMKARKDGGMELQEAVMPGVKTVMCWYNMWSEPPA